MVSNLNTGTLLQGGKYRIEAVLGQGSFGITYVATHTVLNKMVAIKEFFMKELNGRSEDGSITGMSDGSLSIDYARKFQKEAKNLATLEHPNIVKVTDSFAENGTYYYVMDYIEGENLNDYIKHGNVSAQEAVSIICDVAKALEYMHNQKHMLHLDLKPGNVMRRSSDGHIFLIDFGLSKHYSSSGQPETSTTIGLGTPGYAPIEQANQAKNGEFRPTIDVYALGATFFKLLTGETPPAASELVSDDELLVERLRLHHVDDALSRVVVNAMLPNVRKRTQSVSAFIQNLGASECAGTYSAAGGVSAAAYSEETQVLGTGYNVNTTSDVRQNNRQSSGGSNNIVRESSKQSNSFFAGPMAIVLCAVLTLLIILFSVRTCSYTDGTISDGCDTIDTMAVDTVAADTAYYEPYSSNGYSDDNSYYNTYDYDYADSTSYPY